MSTTNHKSGSNPKLSHKIKLAISSCLLGNEVRYDAGHKLNQYITQNLKEYFEFIAFCPEVAVGMGTPRPPIRLVKIDNLIHAVGINKPDLDKTSDLTEYANKVASQKLNKISGFILKKDSPSCGMERVKVYDNSNVSNKIGTGIFAREIMRLCPNLPVEEEGRLMDPVLRENFIERVFVYYRWQQTVHKLTPKTLIEFHSRHKFNVLAHDEPAYRKLGRLVADIDTGNLALLSQNYIEFLMLALKKLATKKKHTNVLMHIMGFIKSHLDKNEKQEMIEILESYRLGKLPLIVPITLLKHYLRRFPHPYIEQQYYMNPYPEELMLRNTL